MKRILFTAVALLALTSCGWRGQKRIEATYVRDTVIVKCQNVLTDSWWDEATYSRAYTYYRIADKDTLDFAAHIYEHKTDSSLVMFATHREPTLWSDAMKLLNDFVPLIKEDFDPALLRAVSFGGFVFYPDIAAGLSAQYEQRFGRKNITSDELNAFLQESGMTSQLNEFLAPFGRKVKYYSIEKFHLVDRRHYESRWPRLDLTDYPDFTFNAHTGIYIALEPNTK